MQNTSSLSFSLKVKDALAAFFLKVAGALPLSFSQQLGKLLGKLMLLLNTREVKIARRNLEICFPQMDLKGRAALLNESFLNAGMQAFEIAHLWRAPANRGLELVNEIEGEEILQEAVNKKQGILLILPHLGNWEMVNAYLLQQMEMTAMYTPAQLPAIEKLMREGRERTGLKLAESNAKGVVRLIKTLNQGGNLAILPDQEPTLQGGGFALFFNQQALTMTLISKMLQKSGAAPVFAFAYRKGAGKGFKLIFREPTEGICSEDLTISLQALNHSVEGFIKEIPEQYMWGYKRFRKRPNGEASLYDNLR